MELTLFRGNTLSLKWFVANSRMTDGSKRDFPTQCSKNKENSWHVPFSHNKLYYNTIADNVRQLHVASVKKAFIWVAVMHATMKRKLEKQC